MKEDSVGYSKKALPCDYPKCGKPTHFYLIELLEHGTPYGHALCAYHMRVVRQSLMKTGKPETKPDEGEQ